MIIIIIIVSSTSRRSTRAPVRVLRHAEVRQRLHHDGAQLVLLVCFNNKYVCLGVPV